MTVCFIQFMSINEMFNKWVYTEEGLKQACVMPPWLFNIFMVNFIINTFTDVRDGFTGAASTSAFLYVDCELLLALNPDNLPQTLDCMMQWSVWMWKSVYQRAR